MTERHRATSNPRDHELDELRRGPSSDVSTLDDVDGEVDVPMHSREQCIDSRLLEKAKGRLDHLYDEVSKSWPGFVARPGQYQMMQTALLTLLSAKAAQDTARSGENLAQLEAGTGTGKTVAYCLAAIVASEMLKKTVVVSTATVALQEQLFHKDLPRLATIVPELRFDILKGRGRYVCESRLLEVVNEEVQDRLVEDEYRFNFGDLTNPKTNEATVAPDTAHAMHWFKDIANKLRTGRWNGDVDTLSEPPDARNWRLVQAHANACNGGQCAHFKTCSFFRARRQAASATIQVANHALVLATLQTESGLIDAANTLFIFDEAHHLPTIAADQFAVRFRVGSSLSLLSSLRGLVVRHAREMPASIRPDPVTFGQMISECTDRLAGLHRYCTEARWVSDAKPTHRFVSGKVPEPLVQELEQWGSALRSVVRVTASVAAALTEAEDQSLSPTQRDDQSRAGLELGVYLARLESMLQLIEHWTNNDAVPWVKWIEYAQAAAGASPSGHADLWFCASPMTAAKILSRGLWREVSAAVCTSATLTACGRFDFFDRLSGLNRFPNRRALVVASPFDYAVQGELRIAPMRHSPKSGEFSAELCQALPALLREHPHGQLALFTSKRQMQACLAALPTELLAQVLVQGERSRSELLKEHARRVESGQRSIIFGLQTFGEGIDLPGKLCEHVLIDKLPFAPPNSPVEEALAEWLHTQGRDSFAEISVPRAAMKLAQWAGRGVRTVTDKAVITVCDTRLVTTGYGRSILAGLPPFPVIRSTGVIAAAG